MTVRQTTNSLLSSGKLFLSLALVTLFAADCVGQTIAPPKQATTEQKSQLAQVWKATTIEQLDERLKLDSTTADEQLEFKARKTWLNNWVPDKLPAQPSVNTQLPAIRTEPILKSELANRLRKKLRKDETDQEAKLLLLKTALAKHPNDIALQQLHLHWMDDLSRRKQLLQQVDAAAILLIKSLQVQDDKTPTIQLATEFAMYRRGRGLAYRELPDVVKQTPIDDQERLDKEMRAAYRDLISTSGTGHPEFVLLEIRMLRRAKQFGQSLALVEQYGSAIKRQWYLKKRRDLLKELDWMLPYAEAAKIYADEFPEEVAKERALSRMP